MNRIASDKARHLYRLFAYGHGLRGSARLAGVNRGTSQRHYRIWLSVRPQLQRAYDHLWEHEPDECDAIIATIPDDLACAMLDCWMDDQDDTITMKSGWHAGYDDNENDAHGMSAPREHTGDGQGD